VRRYSSRPMNRVQIIRPGTDWRHRLRSASMHAAAVSKSP